MLFDKANNVQPRDEAMEAALKALADFDVKNAELVQGGENEKIVKYHLSRIPLLRAIVKAAPTADEKLNYNKQVVDSLIAALRTGPLSAGQGAAGEDRRRRRQARLLCRLPLCRGRLRDRQREAGSQPARQPEEHG